LKNYVVGNRFINFIITFANKRYLLLINDVISEISLHLGEDWSSESSHWIPALGGDVARITTTAFSAVIVAGGDVSEGGLVGSVHLVQQGVGETNRGLAAIQQIAVQKRNHSTKHWR
jgi:hypothetical protein